MMTKQTFAVMRNKNGRISRNVRVLLLVLCGLLAGCFNHEKQNFSNYNYQLMVLQQENKKEVEAMNAALTSGSYHKAENIRKNWKEELTVSIEKASDLPGFRGNHNLQKAVKNGLEGYKKVVENEYEKLIAGRQKNHLLEKQKENELLKHINQSLAEADSTIKDAESAFRLQYGN